jgi:hypothetical protein
MKFPLIPVLFLFLLNLQPLKAQINVGQPTFLVIKQGKPDICPSGGLFISEGYVKAGNNDKYIDVTLYLQRYDGGWEREKLRRKGSGIIRMDISSCDYTGNYYAFACYSDQCSGDLIPSAAEVAKKHDRLGERPRFRITKREEVNDCDNGPGYFFAEGEIFTPRGEAVNLTLFVERKDGSWRKKHYNYTGSGFIEVGIQDCDLTGNYKALVVFNKY